MQHTISAIQYRFYVATGRQLSDEQAGQILQLCLVMGSTDIDAIIRVVMTPITIEDFVKRYTKE